MEAKLNTLKSVYLSLCNLQKTLDTIEACLFDHLYRPHAIFLSKKPCEIDMKSLSLSQLCLN